MSDTWKGLLHDLFTLVLLIVLVVIPIRMFVISPFIVDGASMHPTFSHLDYLVVNQFIYHFQDPERGDVVVFRYPGEPSTFYIKRVIGLPGEKVSILHGVTTITAPDGTSLAIEEPYVVNEDATYTKSVTLRDDEYFVMGDNRPNSSDSRTWGPLSSDNIVGRVDLRLLPVAHTGFFPGSVEQTLTPVVSPAS